MALVGFELETFTMFLACHIIGYIFLGVGQSQSEIMDRKTAGSIRTLATISKHFLVNVHTKVELIYPRMGVNVYHLFHRISGERKI